MFDTVVEDAKKRFKTPETIIARTSSVGIGLVAGSYATRRITAAIKGSSRRTGTGASAAAGAATGSFFGLAGTVAGAVIGGAAGWLASDVVIIKLDEHLNRESFEAKLRAKVDEHKQKIKDEMHEQLHEAKVNINKYTPIELIKSS